MSLKISFLICFDLYILTHSGLVMPYMGIMIIDLVNIGSGNGLSSSAKPLSDQCWLIISEVLRHSSESWVTGNAQDIDSWSEFENNFNFRFQLHLSGSKELTEHLLSIVIFLPGGRVFPAKTNLRKLLR